MMLRASVAPSKPYKILVCGLHKCGKTSILEQLIYGIGVDQDRFPTIEETYTAHIETERGKERLIIYDTSGLDTISPEISRAYLSHADAFILVYAINNSESFALLDRIKKDIDKNRDKKEIIILGNKSDLFKEREVDFNVAQAWATKEKAKLFEVSATERKTLYEPFVYIINRLNIPPSKSTFSQLGRKGKSGIALEL